MWRGGTPRKDVEQVIDVIVAGADSVAVPFHVFEAMCERPMTDKGLEDFMENDRRIPRERPVEVGV